MNKLSYLFFILSALLLQSKFSAHAQTSPSASKPVMSAEQIKRFHDNHILAWNEHNRTKRDSLLRTVYLENIKMYDHDIKLNSLKEVSDFIAKLHKDDPQFYFSGIDKPIDISQNGIRIFGQIGTKQKPNILDSMDFFIIENGKAAHLYVFIAPTGK